jgi:hypothetical protein
MGSRVSHLRNNLLFFIVGIQLTRYPLLTHQLQANRLEQEEVFMKRQKHRFGLDGRMSETSLDEKRKGNPEGSVTWNISEGFPADPQLGLEFLRFLWGELPGRERSLWHHLDRLR